MTPETPPELAGKPSPVGRGSARNILVVLGVGVVIIMICAGVGLGILLPAMSKSRHTVRVLASATRLHLIASALVTYSIQNNGQYPEAGADLRARIGDAVPPDTWGAPDAAPGTPSYVYVPPGDLQQVKDPSTRVLLYEDPSIPDRTSWNVIYLDSHGELIKGSSAYAEKIAGLAGATPIR